MARSRTPPRRRRGNPVLRATQKHLVLLRFTNAPCRPVIVAERTGDVQCGSVAPVRCCAPARMAGVDAAPVGGREPTAPLRSAIGCRRSTLVAESLRQSSGAVVPGSAVTDLSTRSARHPRRTHDVSADVSPCINRITVALVSLATVGEPNKELLLTKPAKRGLGSRIPAFGAERSMRRWRFWASVPGERRRGSAAAWSPPRIPRPGRRMPSVHASRSGRGRDGHAASS